MPKKPESHDQDTFWGPYDPHHIPLDSMDATLGIVGLIVFLGLATAAAILFAFYERWSNRDDF